MQLASSDLRLVPQAEVAMTVATPSQAGLVVDTIVDPADFAALRTEWTALFEAAGRPHQVFQGFEWLSIWARLYVRRGCRLAVVTGRVDGRLVVAWPLVVRRLGGVRILAGMGAPFAQYTDALLAPGLPSATADAVLDQALELPVDLVALRRVREDAALAPWLRRRGLIPSARQAAPMVHFADTPQAAAFEARFSGKIRSSRRRRRRRLEEQGALSFVRHEAVPGTAPLVAMAFGFKREWARRTGIVAPALRDRRFEQIFIDACHAGAAAPAMRVSVLRCGDRTVGIEISAAAKGVLCGHVLAPNPAFADFGAGGVLAEAAIVGALEQGYAAVDLLAPADAYKMEWADATVGVADYVVARSVVGRAYRRVWLDGGREAVKRLAARLRPIMVRTR